MFHFEDISDVERAMLGRTLLIHGLGIDVPRRGHQEEVLRFLSHDEGGIADFAAGQQEVVLGTDGILGQVVDLDEVSGDDGNLGLGARQPFSLHKGNRFQF